MLGIFDKFMKRKSLKKFLTYFSLGLLTSISLIVFYIYIPTKIESIDNTIRDYMFLLRGEIKDTGNVVIVDIDEKSIDKLGQWPWSRNLLSDLLNNLTNTGVGIAGFDIIFSEEDRTSPSKLVEKYNLKDSNLKIENYDEIFAKTVLNSPTILGFQFQFNDTIHKNKEAPDIPAIFIQKNKSKNLETIIKANGILSSIPIIKNSAYSSGHVNNIPDSSGTIRSVPLVISYDNEIYPSLALELVRAAYDTKKVYINYNDIGIDNIQLGNLKIPTNLNGKLLLNFRGKQGSFKYISAVDIIENRFKKEDIEGKIILIGTSSSGLYDLRSTPFDSVFPGVEVHANVIDNLIAGDFLRKPSWIHGLNILLCLSITVILTLILAYSPLWLMIVLIFSSLFLSSYIVYYLLFHMGIVLNIFFIYLSIFSSILVAIICNNFFENKQNKIIRNKFSNKVSKNVMEEILLNDDDTILKGKEKKVTIFFSDIRSFTNISESMESPQKLIEYLNLYMDPMSKIIIDEKGTIDKYIGDAIMAYWNAPNDVVNHADYAVICALNQLKYLENLNKKLILENLPEIKIGIGINTGNCIVGEMGSTLRSDYTIIGDPVNLAARVESLSKRYKAKIIITHFTKDELTENFLIRTLDLVKVKGKEEKIEIFEVLDLDLNSEHTEDKFNELLNMYNNAMTLYRNSHFNKALEIFEEIKDLDDLSLFEICDMYIERCKYLLEHPDENFDGVFVYNEK